MTFDLQGVYLRKCDRVREVTKLRCIVVDVSKEDTHFHSRIRYTMIHAICGIDKQQQRLVVGR